VVTEIELLNVARAVRLSLFSDAFDFFVGLDKGRNLQRNVDAREELLARMLHTSARIKEREDQLTRKTRDFRTSCKVALRLTKDFRTLIVTCNKFVVSVQHICNLNIESKLK
jgi:hypothetical protein